MNPIDLLGLATSVRHKSQKNSALRFHYIVLMDCLNSIIHDFEYIDFELSPTFQMPLRLGYIDYGIIPEPIKAIVFLDEDIENLDKHVFRFDEKHIYPFAYIKSFIPTTTRIEDCVEDIKSKSMNLSGFWLLGNTSSRFSSL
ncbi:hypothetical protein LXL04_029970 [Taraxacum kok-saghyz]